MNDTNDVPTVKVETTHKGTIVTVNGRPVTGPLPPLDAIREQERIQKLLKAGPPTRRGMLPIILILSIAAGLIVFAITGDWSTGALAGAGCFVGTSISFLMLTS